MSLTIQFHPSVDSPVGLDPFPAEPLARLLVDEGVTDTGEIHCVLARDEDLRALNQRFRSRAEPTDVLAFPYDPSSTDGTVGDIYVSIDRAAEQAASRGEPVAREIGRLFVHGALHLAGYRHDNEDEEARMKATQEACVERLFPAAADDA